MRKVFLVLNFSDTCPLNNSFFATRSMQTSLASSPKYIPEIIFSNLKRKWSKISLSNVYNLSVVSLVRDSLHATVYICKLEL